MDSVNIGEDPRIPIIENMINNTFSCMCDIIEKGFENGPIEEFGIRVNDIIAIVGPAILDGVVLSDIITNKLGRIGLFYNQYKHRFL